MQKQVVEDSLLALTREERFILPSPLHASISASRRNAPTTVVPRELW
ncbi:MAG: hypothetical protein LBB27_03780 [Tannerellaceae bacterium]|nr:hypothetical protein [Tannerellaceae bacterium]